MIDPDLAAQDEPGVDELLSYLGESRGFDVSGYKRTGLIRRLAKRIHALQLQSCFEYLDYLQVHPDEFDQLLNTILINATGFFRDPTTWEYLAEKIIPMILEQRAGRPIRVWSAGCATGQEPYSIAMLFAQALGSVEYERAIKIYATDIDEDALGRARQAVYSSKELTGVPAPLIDAYFERTGPSYVFKKPLRRSVIFGRHNLLFDAPISRIDLLLCRNTLMYFNAEAQARILSSLHFALAEPGVLLLGKAEMLLTQSTLFTPLELKRRVFAKVAQAHPRGRASPGGQATRRLDHGGDNVAVADRLRDAAFEAAPIAMLVLDMRIHVVAANQQARRILGVTDAEHGRPIDELSLARKIDGLRAGVEQARNEGRVVHMAASEWLRANSQEALEPQYFDIFANPMLDEQGTVLGVALSFLDVTASRKLREELQQTTKELEAAQGELQAAGEELETANEELQSTVEELETTNEELQSTNEELETTNEELQSTNEELQSMNEELRSRSEALGRFSAYFESILTGLRSAVVVLNLDLRVEVWSDRAQELWGLRGDEVRLKPFASLDIGLPVDQLISPIRACLDARDGVGYQQAFIAATNRRGRAIQCRVLVSRLTYNGQPNGVILLMDEGDANAAPSTVDGSGDHSFG